MAEGEGAAEQVHIKPPALPTCLFPGQNHLHKQRSAAISAKEYSFCLSEFNTTLEEYCWLNGFLNGYFVKISKSPLLFIKKLNKINII